MFLSEKTQKAYHLLISMQKQPFLLNYLKTLSGGPREVWTLVSQFRRQECMVTAHKLAGSGLDNLHNRLTFDLGKTNK